MPNRPLVAPQVQSISFDPAAAMQDVASIQINRQRMDEARRKSMASMRMRQLAQEHPDDPQAFIDAVTREFPDEGFALSESYWKGVKENAQAHKAQTESSVANLEVGTRILQAARQNPALYGAAKQWITKMSPEVGGQLSEQYNEAEVDGWLQTGAKTSDFLKAQADAADRLTNKDTRGSVLTLFAGASNPQQWQTAMDLTKQSGLSPLLGLVEPQWSPEAQAKAAQASISPEKQADDARAAAAEARQTEQFKTTEARLNKQFAVTSGLSAAHLGLARQTEARLAKGGTASTKPSTGAEKKNLGYFNRLKQADEELDKLEKSVSEMGLGGQLRMELLPNFAQSQTGQSYQQAQREFTEARLRKESGAAIPESEYENDRKTYFVQPGDSAQTIAQKKRARSALKASFSFDAGRALGEFYGDEAEGMTAKYQAESKGQAGGIKVTAPNGKSYTFATQAQADIFKKRAGID